MRISGLNRDEVIERWRKLCIEELHNSYEDEMGEACSTHMEKMNVYKVLVGNPEREQWQGLGIDRKIILKRNLIMHIYN
jgi:hypothetical protein